MLAVYSPTVHDFQNSHYQDFDYFSPQYSYHRNSLSSTSASSPPPLIDDQWMSTQPNQYQNPAIRVQKSSPFSTEDQNTQQQMLAQQFPSNSWGSSASLLSPANFAHGGGWEQQRFTGGKHHKRESSASSIASAGPPSPQDSISIYPRIASGEASQASPSHFDSLDFFATPNRGSQMPKSLPTPVDTPIQHTFNPSDYQHFSNPQDAMRRIHQNRSPNHDDDGTSYNYSGPQSVSSVSHHDSPATPQTTSYDGDYGDAVKGLTQGFNPQLNNLPHGLVTGNFDDFYSHQLQNIPQQQQAQIFAKAGGLSPHRTSLASRFQAAQLDHVNSRSSSPAHSIHRERSPFKPGSHEQPTQMSSMTSQRLGPPQMTPVQYQQHQNLNNAAMMAPQRPQQQPEQPKTVSPKDVELEYHEENQTPLFTSSQQSQFSLPREESNFSTTSNLGQPSQFYTSVPVSAPQTQQYPFLGQQRRQQSSLRSHGDQPLPDFPAHLASMETTVSSESGQDIQTPVQAPRPMPPVRPRDTSADVGAYSCTVTGCTQRFGSPAQLQKHKREAHRQTSPATSSPVPSHSAANQGHVSSASTIAARNSQPGPHRCERSNPQTGKPCNAVFSRPYDLTRHEDTIHTGRKQKVRCHLCTEEKTFSRNDALTRHMRVVHPDVDWPGKTRRKGRD